MVPQRDGFRGLEGSECYSRFKRDWEGVGDTKWRWPSNNTGLNRAGPLTHGIPLRTFSFLYFSSLLYCKTIVYNTFNIKSMCLFDCLGYGWGFQSTSNTQQAISQWSFREVRSHTRTSDCAGIPTPANSDEDFPLSPAELVLEAAS